MDNDKRTSNALLVVLATFVVTVAFLGVVIEYFDKDKEIVTTFWAPPWTVMLEADIEESGLPEVATLSINNEGTRELYGRAPILVFAKDNKVAATASVDNDIAHSFSVASQKERSITLDFTNLTLENLDGDIISPAELEEGNWTARVAFYAMRADSKRPQIAWSDPLPLSAMKSKKAAKADEETDMEDAGDEMEAEDTGEEMDSEATE